MRLRVSQMRDPLRVAPFRRHYAEKQDRKTDRKYTPHLLRRWAAVADRRYDEMFETTGPVPMRNVFKGMQPVLAEFVLGTILVFGKQQKKKELMVSCI